MAADLLASMRLSFPMCPALTGTHADPGFHVLAREVALVDAALREPPGAGLTLRIRRPA